MIIGAGMFFFFVTAILFCQAILQQMFKGKIKVNKRMEEFVPATKTEEIASEEPSVFLKKSKETLDRLREYLASKTSLETKSELEKKLRDAGYPPSLTAVEFRFLQTIFGAALFFITFLLCSLISNRILSITFFSVALSALGFYYPMFQVSARKKKRMEMVQKTMPEFFDMVNLAVEAGMGLDAAILKVCRQTKGPLSEEFALAIEDMRLGKSRREAFVHLRSRIPVEAFQSVMTSLIQADQIGIGLSKVLKTLTERIREQQRQLAREKAMKAPVKMIFPMLLFIFPSIFIILLGPIAIYLITNGFK